MVDMQCSPIGESALCTLFPQQGKNFAALPPYAFPLCGLSFSYLLWISFPVGYGICGMAIAAPRLLTMWRVRPSLEIIVQQIPITFIAMFNHR